MFGWTRWLHLILNPPLHYLWTLRIKIDDMHEITKEYQ